MDINVVDIFSIISSALSLALGVIAIWLSITFYKMSDKSAKDAEKSANSIEASVRKLETLFDKLYSGTFDMMRETVTDMRKHFYLNESTTIDSEKITKEIGEKTSVFVQKAVEEIKSSQKSEKELEKYIYSILNKSKTLEEDVKMNALREEILNMLSMEDEMTFKEIKNYIANAGLAKTDSASVFHELYSLAKDGIVNDPFEREPRGGISIDMDAKFKLKKTKK